MDPRKQECIGFFLYGAGHQARDENTLGLATGKRSASPHFCLTCPVRQACEDEHERHVREAAPEAAENFDRLMADARARDIPPTLAAVYLGQKGLDPYAIAAVENFKLGHRDRGRESGTLLG